MTIRTVPALTPTTLPSLEVIGFSHDHQTILKIIVLVGSIRGLSRFFLHALKANVGHDSLSCFQIFNDI